MDRYSYLLDALFWFGAGGVALWAGSVLSESGRRIVGICAPALLAVVVIRFATVSGVVLPAWKESDVFFSEISMHPNFRKSWSHQAHVLKLWSWHLEQSGYPRAAAWRLGQAHGIYQREVVMALERGDLAALLMW